MVEGKVILRSDCMVEYECYENTRGNASGGNVYVGWGWEIVKRQGCG